MHLNTKRPFTLRVEANIKCFLRAHFLQHWAVGVLADQMLTRRSIIVFLLMFCIIAICTYTTRIQRVLNDIFVQLEATSNTTVKMFVSFYFDHKVLTKQLRNCINLYNLVFRLLYFLQFSYKIRINWGAIWFSYKTLICVWWRERTSCFMHKMLAKQSRHNRRQLPVAR